MIWDVLFLFCLFAFAAAIALSIHLIWVRLVDPPLVEDDEEPPTFI